MSKWKFNSAKWDIMSAFNDVDNDDIPNNIKELENIKPEKVIFNFQGFENLDNNDEFNRLKEAE